jgi:hypothetical protein
MVGAFGALWRSRILRLRVENLNVMGVEAKTTTPKQHKESRKSEDLRYKSLELWQLSADLRKSATDLAAHSAELRNLARCLANLLAGSKNHP